MVRDGFVVMEGRCMAGWELGGGYIKMMTRITKELATCVAGEDRTG